MSSKILVVDDESDICLLLAGVLEDEGFQVTTASSDSQAMELFKSIEPDLVLLDIWLEGSKKDGLALLEYFKSKSLLTPVLMMSGHGTIETAVKAIQVGAYDFIEKPFKTDRLFLLVHRALESSALKKENQELKLQMGAEPELNGNSPSINQLRQSIEKVAPTGSRVLITGPAGSGKEIAARLIHARSRRNESPFVLINCATIHPERFETELFGEEFDNGLDPKRGYLEQADGGTLLLDEIADMPIETQGKIVRILQDQSFYRINGSQSIQVDVRVLASTNKNLEEEITANNFRQDLYYRLSVVPIKVPSLKERREDIAELVNTFVDRFASSSGRPARPIGDDAMAVLQSYHWPGNVRQLRNAVEWLIIMAPGDPGETIRPDMLPPEIASEAPAALMASKTEELMALPLRDAREQFERHYLESQVLRFSGNITKTASFIGMERSALHRKLRALNISQL